MDPKSIPAFLLPWDRYASFKISGKYLIYAALFFRPRIVEWIPIRAPTRTKSVYPTKIERLPYAFDEQYLYNMVQGRFKSNTDAVDSM